MPASELDVPCPRCAAPEGRFCRMPSGGSARSHAARRRAWLNQRPAAPAAAPEPQARVRPLEHLVLALELAQVEAPAAEECADLLDDAATAIEDAATRCDGGDYWMDDHVTGRERVPCAGCLALARRLRDRAGHIRAGTA